MDEPREGYRAYLLRLWQVSDKGQATCRASLENIHTGERLGFASLDRLVDYLRAQADVKPGRKEAEGKETCGPRRK
jgi:hypothetical protein